MEMQWEGGVWYSAGAFCIMAPAYAAAL